jgi:hypothetical protein
MHLELQYRNQIDMVSMPVKVTTKSCYQGERKNDCSHRPDVWYCGIPNI